jgi:hypothetical protein
MIKFFDNLFNKPEKYGNKLGSYNEIVSYSTHNKYDNLEKNYIRNIFCGYKWQCVEFVRRYLIIKFNITFQQIDYAYQIFNLYNFKCLLSGNPIKIYNYKNGSCILPKTNSILVWSYKYKSTGHVAIIIEIQESYIKIIEQNWNNKKWDENYSRKINVKYNSGYWILDDNILGWINF